jgi:hypothetical protein
VEMMNQKANVDAADQSWNTLYRVGGVAALTVVAFMIVQIFVFIAWPRERRCW